MLHLPPDRRAHRLRPRRHHQQLRRLPRRRQPVRGAAQGRTSRTPRPAASIAAAATTPPTGPARPARPTRTTPPTTSWCAALLPTFAGTSMVSLTSQSETLSMTMNHGSTDASAAVMSDCANCHPNSKKSGFFPGVFHESLGDMQMRAADVVQLVPPGRDADRVRRPDGDQPRAHAAVGRDAPRRRRLGQRRADQCAHRLDQLRDLPPRRRQQQGHLGHRQGRRDRSVPRLAQQRGPGAADVVPGLPRELAAAGRADQDQLVAAGRASRSTTPWRSRRRPVTARACHAATAAPSFSSWQQGQFHLCRRAEPADLPALSRRRAADVDRRLDQHDVQEFAVRLRDQRLRLDPRRRPGLRALPLRAGHRRLGRHPELGERPLRRTAPTTHAAQTCIACHSTQRPDLQPGTTAAAAAAAMRVRPRGRGAGECLGCHAATIAADQLRQLHQSVDAHVARRRLEGRRRLSGILVRGLERSVHQRHRDAVWSATGRPRTTCCARRRSPTRSTTGCCTRRRSCRRRCRRGRPTRPTTPSAGTATPAQQRHGHQLQQRQVPRRARPTSARRRRARSRPYPQPTTQCSDCHSYMMPDGIVELKGSDLWPMDHKAVLATPIMVGAATVAKVSDLDCSFCHKSPGKTWSDGVFHANLPSTAVVSDCNGCHYPLIDRCRGLADTCSGTLYAMKHLSPLMTESAMQAVPRDGRGQPRDAAGRVHAVRGEAPSTARTHGRRPNRPAASIVTWSRSRPPNVPTQSTVTYAFKAGGTSTNGAQWMNHGSSLVAGKDCAACHLKPTRRRWAAPGAGRLSLHSVGAARAHLPGVPRSGQRRRRHLRHQEQPAGGAHQLDGRDLGERGHRHSGEHAGADHPRRRQRRQPRLQLLPHAGRRGGVGTDPGQGVGAGAIPRQLPGEHAADHERHDRPLQQLPHERQPQVVVHHVQSQQLQQLREQHRLQQLPHVPGHRHPRRRPTGSAARPRRTATAAAPGNACAGIARCRLQKPAGETSGR